MCARVKGIPRQPHGYWLAAMAPNEIKHNENNMTTTRLSDQIMKTQTTPLPAVALRKFPIAMLIGAVAFALLLGTGLETYLNQERRLVNAGNEIVTALEAYRAASPGSAKELPRSLDDLLHDPRMLADKGYLLTLPVDPVTQKQAWGVIKNNVEQIIGVHSLSTATPTWIGRLLSLRSGDTYADWQFLVASL